MNDRHNTSTITTQRPLYTLFNGDTNPITMLTWFALLALALHIKSMLWLSQPFNVTKPAKPLPIQITLLPIPLKQADVQPIKPKPIQEPKPPLPKPKPKPAPPKPKIPAKPKPIPPVQPKPVVRTKPMAKTLVDQPKETETIAPVAPVSPPVSNKPAIQTSVNNQNNTHANTSTHTSHNPDGDQFVQADYRPNYGFNPKPKYPQSAKNRHLEGKALLTVKVSAEGFSELVTIQKSSGHEILDNAAVEAVQKWKFIPAKRGNKAVACTVTVPISFKLQ